MSIINFTNHPSDLWGEKQKSEALKYGEIIDIPFPKIDAGLDEEEIKNMAFEYLKKIYVLKPKAVICQGEFTLVYAVVTALREKGVKVLSACSERKVKETIMDDGTVQKTAIFDFVKFREYTEVSLCQKI
jgi:hypothetical protein